MFYRSTTAALLAVACATAPAAAQSAQRWSIQASGLYVGVFGKAYEGLKSGIGGEVQARVTPSLWSYGFGLQFSSHGVKNLRSTNIALQGIFFEPRRVFDTGNPKFAPYVSSRLAVLQQAASFDVAQGRIATQPGDVALAVQSRASTAEFSATGFQGNVGGGVLIKLSPRVNLDLGATLGLIRFGDVAVKVDGRSSGTFPGTSGTGQNAVVRAGLAIGLGAGAKKPAAPVTKPATRPTRRQ
jgi:Outer membrane protein beta-barrel domain